MIKGLNKYELILLLTATAVMLFVMLASFPLWTGETCWSAVTWQMLHSGNYWHPSIYWEPYYDKPLLSYWLIIGFAKLFHGLNTYILRLPSALAGIVTVFCTYKLGAKLTDKKTGLLAGWLLITTYYFVFYSRIAFADMLNMASIMLAVLWFFCRKDKAKFLDYFIFFAICFIGSLLKGLLSLVIPVLVILPILLWQQQWRKHLKLSLLIAFVVAAILYLIPFFISAHNMQHDVGRANGLYEVLRENIVRYFHPFDHQKPIYAYLIYLPVYTLPWLLFLPNTIYSYCKQYKTLSINEKWPLMAALLIFVFFSLSISKRSYYILPVLPFVMLSIAMWMRHKLKPKIITILIVIFFSLLAAWFLVIQPIYYIKHNPQKNFAYIIRTTATNIAPWSKWQIREQNAEDVIFYLRPKQNVKKLILPKTYTQLPHQQIWMIEQKYAKPLKQILPSDANSYTILTSSEYIVIIWK